MIKPRLKHHNHKIEETSKNLVVLVHTRNSRSGLVLCSKSDTKNIEAKSFLRLIINLRKICKAEKNLQTSHNIWSVLEYVEGTIIKHVCNAFFITRGQKKAYTTGI